MTDKYIPTKLTKYCRVTIIYDGLKLNSNDNDDDDYDDDNSVSVNFVISFFQLITDLVELIKS